MFVYLYLCHVVSSTCHRCRLHLLFVARQRPSNRAGVVWAAPSLPNPSVPRGRFSTAASSCFGYSWAKPQPREHRGRQQNQQPCWASLLSQVLEIHALIPIINVFAAIQTSGLSCSSAADWQAWCNIWSEDQEIVLVLVHVLAYLSGLD